MNSGFFVAGVSGQMEQQKMDGITHNLANVNTVGFLGSHSSFKTVFSRQSATTNPAAAPAAFPGMGDKFIDMHEGNIEQTGNSLDFAILGDGWFRVQLSPGQEAYTRAGNFKLDASGNLRTQDGRAVLDSSGSPIQLPPGELSANSRGELIVHGATVATLGIVKIRNPRAMERIGNVLVKTAVANTEPANNVGIQQGALESSNVNSVLAMSEMIETLRSYQAMIKIIEQYNQQSAQLNQKVGQIQGP